MDKRLGIFALAIVSVLLVSSFVFAQEFQLNDLTDEEIADMQETRDAIRTAIENNDYSTWKGLMEAQLTQERFDKLVERHSQMSEVRELMDELREAHDAGDQDRVDELREQLQELRPERNGNFEDRGRPQSGNSPEDMPRGVFQKFRGFLGR